MKLFFTHSDTLWKQGFQRRKQYQQRKAKLDKETSPQP